MAIDPLQRQMFGVRPGALPGVNPRNVAGGIYNLGNMGNAQPVMQPVPVAARPLQVASLGQPPTRTIIAPSQPDFQQEYDQATAQINAARQEQVPQTDITALLEARSQIVEAAEGAGQTLTIGDDDGERIDEGANSILAAADNATEGKVAETGGATGADANVAKTNAKGALDAVRDAETSLQAQLKLANLGKSVDLDSYQAQAKKLLGVDENEADVPDWAAPMFLFGMNLMKGPVSGKVQGQTGVGGLLSDIGAAGEKGFAFFAAERTRKRKEKATIAQMALNLKKTDDATKAASLKSLVESRRWWADYKLKREKETRIAGDAGRELALKRKREIRIAVNADRDFFAQQHDRMANRFLGKNPNIDDTTNFYVALSTEEGRILSAPVEKGGGARGLRRLYDNPGRMMLLGSLAAKKAGLAPEFKTETITFGPGTELTYSKNGVRNYARKNNLTEGNVISQIIADPQNKKWDGISLAVNLGKNQIEYTTPKAEGVVTPTWVDIGLQEKELAAARDGNRAVDPKAFTKTGIPYLESNQEMKKLTLGNFGGDEKYAYVNLPKLALINAQRRKGNKPEINLMDALKNPQKAPGVVSPKFSDTSGALNNLSIVELNVGATTTQDYLFNKNILDTKRKEIAEKLGIEESEVSSVMTSGEKIPWETLTEIGVLTPLAKPRDHKKPVTKTIMGRDGNWQVVEGFVGDIAGMESAANQQKLQDKVVSLAKANRAAYIIDNVYANMATTRDGALISSKWTDWMSSAGVAGKLVGFGESALNRDLSQIRNYELVNGGPGREATNKLINNWSSGFDKWAATTTLNATARQKLKSLFIGMAFDLASSREGGKLTDNDVTWAFKTLGFDTDAYLQNPAVVMTGLKTAIGQASMGLEMELMTIHEDAQAIREHNKDPANTNNQRYLLEEVLASRWSGVDPGEVQPFYTTPEGKKVYRFDKSPHVFDRRRSQTGGDAIRPTTNTNQQSFQYNDQTITYTGAPLSDVEQTTVTVLQGKNVPRTVAGVKAWFDNLSDAEKGTYAPIIKSLRNKGFFQ